MIATCSFYLLVYFVVCMLPGLQVFSDLKHEMALPFCFVVPKPLQTGYMLHPKSKSLRISNKIVAYVIMIHVCSCRKQSSLLSALQCGLQLCWGFQFFIRVRVTFNIVGLCGATLKLNPLLRKVCRTCSTMSEKPIQLYYKFYHAYPLYILSFNTSTCQ